MNTTINNNRLLHLAIHLICIKETYYFENPVPPEECFNQIDDEGAEFIPLVFQPFLELPHLFPREWYTTSDVAPLWVEDAQLDTVSSVMGFFGLNLPQFNHLFLMGKQLKIYGGEKLRGNSCRSQTIGKNIVELVKKVRFIESDLMKNISLN